MPGYDYEAQERSKRNMVTKGVRYGGLSLAAVLLAVVGSCSVHRITPDAGEVAVLVSQPRLIGSGGVLDQPVTTGSEYVATTTKAIMINVQPQQRTFNADDLMSSNGIPLHFDAAIRYQVTDPVTLVKKFGPNWYDNNLSVEFANRVRKAVRKHSMNELAIESTGVDQVDAEVTQGLNQYIRQSGLPIRLIHVTVGKATPPPEIKAQRIRTAEQQQRQETERQTKIAEDNREAAERSRAIADNAYRQTLNLTPNEFVELQRIKMQEEACVKKEGGCTFIIGADTRTSLPVR